MLTRLSKKLKIEQEEAKNKISDRQKHMSIVFGEVLHEILVYTPTETVRTGRRVSQSWNLSAQKILVFRPDHKLTFQYMPISRTYTLSLNESRTKRNRRLDNFTNLASKPIKRSSSPRPLTCTHFSFRGGTLDTSDIKSFLNLFGSSIRGLTLDLDNHYRQRGDPNHEVTLDTFNRLLSIQLPILESLTITRLPWTWRRFEELPDNFLVTSLPHLKLVDARQLLDCPVVRKLLSAAVNLKVIPIFSFSIPSKTLQNIVTSVSSSVLQIQTTNVIINGLPSPDDLEVVLKFSDLGMICKKLNFGLSSRPYRPDPVVPLPLTLSQIAQAEQALLKIFTNAQDSVENVQFDASAFALLNKLETVGQLPSFLKVTEIEVYAENNEPQPFCDEWPRMALVFPNLQNVNLYLNDSWALFSFLPPLNEEHQVVTVTRLTINGDVTSIFPEDLHILFPNVEYLKLRGLGNFSGNCKHIFTFTKLTSLDIEIELADIGLAELDAAFIGFSKGTISGIVDGSLVVGDDRDKYRDGPSIVDLKELKMLRIEMEDSGDNLKSGYDFLTEVSIHHAFSLLPDLEIHLYFEEYCFCKRKNFSVLKESLKPFTSHPRVKFNA